MMVIAKKTLLRTGLLAIAVMVSGCVSSDMSDLQLQVEEILARPGGRLEPLPEIKPYEAYAYKSAQEGARDPFELFYQISTSEVADAKDSGLTEAMEREIKFRNREELESYELDSLRMVGTLEDQDTQWGIIRDPQGTVHRVRVGNYLGRNIGKILTIQEDRIELREIIKNIDGRWEERQAALALAGE
jgi:type IV pilus assembly protein PilP